MSNNYLQDIMEVKIEHLTQERIQISINNESKNHSPKTIRNIHGLLSAVLLMFDPNFVLHTTLPQKKEITMNIPDDDIISKLLKAIKGTKIELPVLLATFGALRRGEICALNVDDLKGNILTINKSLAHSENGEWIMKSPKTISGYRSIELPEFIVDKFKQCKGKVFDGSPDSLTLAFRKVLEKNDIQHFRFHDLRHYNVSMLHAMGIPDKYIMARGGWKSNYTMNNVYNHALKNKKSEFDEKISEHINNTFLK